MRVTSWRLALTLLSFGASAALADVRGDVGEIATLIEQNYFDPARAATIAADLRNDAAKGAFDTLQDSKDLAANLTQRLRALDGHFRVRWDEVGGADRPPPLRKEPPEDSHHGFERVERLDGNIGYIKLAGFEDIDFQDAHSPERAAADAALQTVRGTKAAIFDLRGNHGGAPSMVGYLVSAFVARDANVYNTFHERNATESERPAIAYAKPMLKIPVYILTDGHTGSAAESFAFTLQSCGRAKVVGERSGGAANPGGMFRTPSGYSVFISTGSPRNPINGRNWERVGVQPDIAVEAAQALEKALTLACAACTSPARR